MTYMGGLALMVISPKNCPSLCQHCGLIGIGKSESYYAKIRLKKTCAFTHQLKSNLLEFLVDHFLPNLKSESWALASAII